MVAWQLPMRCVTEELVLDVACLLQEMALEKYVSVWRKGLCLMMKLSQGCQGLKAAKSSVLLPLLSDGNQAFLHWLKQQVLLLCLVVRAAAARTKVTLGACPCHSQEHRQHVGG